MLMMVHVIQLNMVVWIQQQSIIMIMMGIIIANPLSEIDSININTDNGACFPIAYGCTDCDEDDGTPIANNCQPNFLIANTEADQLYL